MKCLLFIADQITTSPELAGVVGLQVCNQASPNAPGLYEWYNKIADEIFKIDKTLPIYISDGWNFGEALEWSRNKNVFPGQPTNPIIVDTRGSYISKREPTPKSSEAVVAQVESELHELGEDTPGSITDHNGAVAAYVGQYSSALVEERRGKNSRIQWADLTIQFGRSQSERWQKKASGCAFWTLKIASNNPKWAFPQQVAMDALEYPKCFLLTAGQLRRKLAEVDHKRSQLMAAAMNRHVKYFDKIGGDYEHWRYADGWHLGFTDARAFYASRLQGYIPGCELALDGDIIGADKIGMLDMWLLKRMKEEEVISRDKCEFVWEWEHGFKNGYRTFHEVVETI